MSSLYILGLTNLFQFSCAGLMKNNFSECHVKVLEAPVLPKFCRRDVVCPWLSCPWFSLLNHTNPSGWKLSVASWPCLYIGLLGKHSTCFILCWALLLRDLLSPCKSCQEQDCNDSSDLSIWLGHRVFRHLFRYYSACVKVFLDEIIIWIGRLSKADCPP